MRPTRLGPSWVTSNAEAKPHRKALPGGRQVQGTTRWSIGVVGQATPGRLAAPAYQAVDRYLRQTAQELAIIF